MVGSVLLTGHLWTLLCLVLEWNNWFIKIKKIKKSFLKFWMWIIYISNNKILLYRCHHLAFFKLTEIFYSNNKNSAENPLPTYTSIIFFLWTKIKTVTYMNSNISFLFLFVIYSDSNISTRLTLFYFLKKKQNYSYLSQSIQLSPQLNSFNYKKNYKSLPSTSLLFFFFSF